MDPGRTRWQLDGLSDAEHFNECQQVSSTYCIGDGSVTVDYTVLLQLWTCYQTL